MPPAIVAPEHRPTVRLITSRRALAIGVATLIVIGAVAGYEFLSSVTNPSKGVMAGAVDEFPANSVTYVPAGHFFLVNTAFGLRAIAEQPFGYHEARCNVHYWLDDWTEGSGRGDPAGGFFKGDCSYTRFNWWRGESLLELCQCGLDHFRVRIDGGQVFVDTAAPIRFSWSY